MELKVESLIEREGDYTVRLLNKDTHKPERVIFGLLLFDGNISSWLIRFMTRKRVVMFADSRKRFEEARQVLIEKVDNYLDMG